MKRSDDETLFAWQVGYGGIEGDTCGPLAPHPSHFRGINHLFPMTGSTLENPYSMTNKGLTIVLPVIHPDDGPYGMAILSCNDYNSTYSSPQMQIGLPVVRLGPEASNRYARDARIIGPLTPVKNVDASPKTIFVTHDSSPQRESSGLLVRLPAGQDALFRPRYWTTSFSALVEGKESQAEYRIPSDHRRGAILFQGPSRSHILILFNIEMQYVGQWACKVLYVPAESRLPDHELTTMQKTIQRACSTISLLSDSTVSSQVLAAEIEKEPDWSLTHDNDHRPSNSRYSMAYLPNNHVAYAQIEKTVVRGMITLVLNVEFQDRSQELQRPYELVGSEVPIPLTTKPIYSEAHGGYFRVRYSQVP